MLRNGRIGETGLDTFLVEPAVLPGELRRLPNLVVSPHAGAVPSKRAGERVGLTAMDDAPRRLSATRFTGRSLRCAQAEMRLGTNEGLVR